MKKCPFCAEEIQDEAIKCRFCGEYFKKKKKWQTCLMSCLITFIISMLLLILFMYLGFFILRLILNKAFFGTFRFPPYYSPPFTGGGLEGFLRDFAQVFRALWERLIDFLHLGAPNYRVTF